MWVCHAQRHADDLDLTVRLKFQLKDHPTLTTPAAIADFCATFGAVDPSEIVFSLKSGKKKGSTTTTTTAKPKSGVALVPFRRIGDAYAAVCASKDKQERVKGVNIEWVRGEEPGLLGWLRRKGQLPDPSKEAAKNAEVEEDAGRPGPTFVAGEDETAASRSSGWSSFPSSFPSFVSSPSCPEGPPADSLWLL